MRRLPGEVYATYSVLSSVGAVASAWAGHYAIGVALGVVAFIAGSWVGTAEPSSTRRRRSE